MVFEQKFAFSLVYMRLFDFEFLLVFIIGS